MKRRDGAILLVAGVFFLAGIAFYSVSKRTKPAKVKAPIVRNLTAPTVSTPAIPAPAEEISTAARPPGLLVEVVDPKGAPVEGARVFDARKVPPLATTDEKGAAVVPFDSLTPTSVAELGTIRVDHEGFAPAYAKVRREAESVRIVLAPGALLLVHVVGEAEQAIPGAEVKAFDMERGHWGVGWARTHKTNAEGNVRVTGIPAGGLIVRVEAAGFEEGRKFVVAPVNEVRTVRFKLDRAKRLNVKVRAPGGEPVADVEVSVTAEFSNQGRTLADGYRTGAWSKTTDRSGVAVFDSLPPVLAKAHVSAKARAHPRTRWMAVDVSGPATDADITLDPGATLTVDVVDPGGTSVAGRVSVSGGPLQSSQPEAWQEKAAGAKARFEGVPVGVPLTVHVSRHQGTVHVETGLTLTPSESRELTLTLPTQCAVLVQVRDAAGTPVPGRLQLARQPGAPGVPPAGVKSGNLGYTVQVPREGQAQLSAFAGNYKAYFNPLEGTRVEKEVRIEADMTLEIEVETANTVTGTLQDSTGAPLAGARIHWSESKGYWGTLTDGQGRFTLIRVTHQGGKLFGMYSGVNVLLFEGAPQHDLRLTLPISTIRGRVVRATGEPAVGMIWASAHSTPGFQPAEGASPFFAGDDGTFEFRVPSGRWQFWVYSEEGTYQQKPFEVDASAPGGMVEVTFPLEPGPAPK